MNIEQRLAESIRSFHLDALAGSRNAYVRWIEATKRRPEVRAARIAETVTLLRNGHKERPRD